MHRIADPEDAVLAGGFEKARELALDVLCAHARDERQAARFVVGVETLDEAQDVVRRGRGAELDSDRVPDAAEELHVSAAEIARPLPDPRQVRGEIVVARPVRHFPREGALVGQVEALVAGEEVDARQLFNACLAERLHEVHAVT